MKKKELTLNQILALNNYPYAQKDWETDLDREIFYESIADCNEGTAYSRLHDIFKKRIWSVEGYAKELTGLRFFNIENDTILDYILKDIRDSKLALGPINYNDPMDPLLKIFLKPEMHHSISLFEKDSYKFMNSYLDNLRASCLCNYKKNETLFNVLMWSHYAKNHTGIAIQYDITPEDIRKACVNGKRYVLYPIQYKNTKLCVDDITVRESLALKSKAWKYENEFRVLYFCPGKQEQYVHLKCRIKAVYLGVGIDYKKKHKILDTLKNVDCEIYQMIYKSNDVLKLDFRECKR